MENTGATPAQTPKKLNVKKEILDWVKDIAIALVAVFLIRTFLFTMIRVDGQSMIDTLHDGDRLAVTIIDLKINGPQRGDIIICTYPGADHLCVKRVIGMPGETLELREGTVYIDGTAMAEDYLTHLTNRDFGPVTIEAEHYFVMGDNRPNSKDSRDPSVGALEKSAIHGKARLIVWPFTRWENIS